MRILNFGSLNIDYVYSVDDIVKPGCTIAASGVQVHPGGKGLNQSIALARAGGIVVHAGCIGKDGEFLYSLLRENGADVSHLKYVDDKTGQAFIQVSKTGENSIVIYHGANYRVTKVYIDAVLENFGEGDFLILQNEISNVPYIIDRAYAKGMVTVLNPSPFDDEIKAIDLNKISYLLLNEHEAAGYTGLTDTAEFIKCVRSTYENLKVVLTLGGKGCIYFDRERTVCHPAFKVSAVDTTAAGDTFTGYFIAGISNGQTPEKAVKYACAAAGLSVSKMGAASSIPTLLEVEGNISKLKLADLKGNEKTVRQYFAENYSVATLEGLAKTMGYSASYTVRWLKNNMNTTFSELLLDCRCAAAADMLLCSDKAVSEIIYQVGYKNESFFRRAFIQKYGVTPLSYRKKGGTNNE